MKALLVPIFVLACVPVLADDCAKRWTIAIESGARWNGLNDAAIPGDTGTRFSLADLTGKGARLSGRITVTYRMASGPEWRVLYAPLSLRGTGALAEPIDFEGAVFAPDVATTGSYRFDSYRVTYRNRFRTRSGSDWRVGATIKVRSAEIALRQGALSRSKTDLGVVPLLHLYGEEPLGGRWSLAFELDGAWAPQGRAIDAALQFRYRASDDVQYLVGFRVLDGGADNDSVYTFARFETLFAGVQVRF